MNKSTTVIIAIVVGIIAIAFIGNTIYWRWISPHTWGRCTSNGDCVPWEPEPGMNYICDDGECKAVPFETECSADSDCVPATCCHASEAVPLAEAPDCSDIFCTTVCEPGTIDCGQGEIKCVNGKCEAVISQTLNN